MVKAIRLAATFACSVMLFGMLLFLVIPGPLLSIFSASEQMLAIGEPALRLISTSFAFAGTVRFLVVPVAMVNLATPLRSVVTSPARG